MKAWPLGARDINYYERTADRDRIAAKDRGRSLGGLGEYYSEHGTREPRWLVVGDTAKVGRLTGLSAADLAGGVAKADDIKRWWGQGIAPNGARGNKFRRDGLHGIDMVFSIPKSDSVMRAVTTDEWHKQLTEANNTAIRSAMEYLWRTHGETRVGAGRSGQSTFEHLPGLVAVAYQHETSREGDPHCHVHVIVFGAQACDDGKLRKLDSDGLFHAAKAASCVHEATYRHETFHRLQIERDPVDPHSGTVGIAGFGEESTRVWSKRKTALDKYAEAHLDVVDGKATAAQRDVAQRASRPTKPEEAPEHVLRAEWRRAAEGREPGKEDHRIDHRAIDRGQKEARKTRAKEREAALRSLRERIVAAIDTPTFDRDDLIEVVAASMPIDEDDPIGKAEALADSMVVQVTPGRKPHQRARSVLYTLPEITREEERILETADARDWRSVIPVTDQHTAGLEADQVAAVRNICTSDRLVQPLQAPAGAGKTTSLGAVHASARDAGKSVVYLASTGKAVDEGRKKDAGDRYGTVALALMGKVGIDRNSFVIVDEASMVGNRDYGQLQKMAIGVGAKIVPVGDSYQLAPVKARGGMFEQLHAELPWSSGLSQVRRMSDPAERDMSLAIRDADGEKLAEAVAWYRDHDRLRCGDEITMVADAVDWYAREHRAGTDALLMCDTWRTADAVNVRLHNELTTGPAAKCAKGEQQVSVGDIVVSRRNKTLNSAERGGGKVSVRNGNRWRVDAVDPHTNKPKVWATRLDDGARVMFAGAYLHQRVRLGYAITVQSAQGATVERAAQLLHENASRCLAYMGHTRGRELNVTFISHRDTAPHRENGVIPGDEVVPAVRGTKFEAARLFAAILANDDRPRTAHVEAARCERAELPQLIQDHLVRNDARRATREQLWATEREQERQRAAEAERAAAERDAWMRDALDTTTHRPRGRGRGRDEMREWEQRHGYSRGRGDDDGYERGR